MNIGASRNTGDPARPDLLLAIDLAAESLRRLQEVCTVHRAVTPEAREALAAERGRDIRAILTNGTTIIPPRLIASLPNLGIICAQGVGYEGIALDALKGRDVVVTNGPGTNAECVADHAMGLMLAVLRDIPRNDANVRSGRWRQGNSMRPSAHGKRVGILGLGHIGGLIAKRCSGFDMEIMYHNRRPLPDAAWPYAATPLELARWSDILFVVVPGGATTRHIVGQPELQALGKQGFLINVGRGSAVDTDALVQALDAGDIAGAALDVIEGEPEVPASLAAQGNLVLSPHIAGRSPESLSAVIALVVANLTAYFSGQPVLTPVPGFGSKTPAGLVEGDS
jgi:D-3-phosphoglycerate dehydrogenase / 2-oxoglutarate reductase